MKREQASSVFNMGDAKAKLDELMERAHCGEDIIIAKRGRPYARLVSLENDQGSELHPAA